ncbi:MAG: hypothetical protein KGV44_05080 [Flavobacteriaceae bacterium]|nr:hypothetical protein [Flavobacteriaceae bacterium]
MKKVVLAVSILLVSLVSCKKEEDNPNAPTNPTIEKESSKGKLSKIIESSLDNETEVIITYNKNGFVSEFKFGGAIGGAKNIYIYNEKNYLVGYKFKNGAETETTTYRYDEDGFLISSTTKNIFSDNSSITEKKTYKHDEKGNIIEKSTIIKSEPNEYVQKYSYDTKGNLIKVVRGDGKELSVYVYVYSYDDKKNPFKEMFPKNAFDIGIPLYLMCNNNIVETIDNYSKGTWKYRYNKKGYPVNATYSRENITSNNKKQRVKIMEFYYNK